MDEKTLFKAQRKSISSMKEKLAYQQMLYKLTKHSKRRNKHLAGIKFYRECIIEMYEEYGWR